MPPPEVVVENPRKPDVFSKQSFLKMAAMLKPNAEYNRKSAIIEGLRTGRSATEIIRFFGYSRSIVYDVVAKQSNEDSSMPARKSHSKERTASHWKGSSADFGWTRAIVAKISIDCWCKRANNASNCRGGHLRYKSYTLKIWHALCCQDKPSCWPRFLFLASQRPRFKSLGLLRMKHSWKSQISLGIPMWRH